MSQLGAFYESGLHDFYESALHVRGPGLFYANLFALDVVLGRMLWSLDLCGQPGKSNTLAGSTIANGLAIDTSGNLWTAGRCSTPTAGGDFNLFKITPGSTAGTVAASYRIAGASVILGRMVIDAGDNLYVIGSDSGFPRIYKVASGSGSLVWTKTIPSINTNWIPQDLCLDAAGDYLYVIGTAVASTPGAYCMMKLATADGSTVYHAVNSGQRIAFDAAGDLWTSGSGDTGYSYIKINPATGAGVTLGATSGGASGGLHDSATGRFYGLGSFSTSAGYFWNSASAALVRTDTGWGPTNGWLLDASSSVYYSTDAQPYSFVSFEKATGTILRAWGRSYASPTGSQQSAQGRMILKGSGDVVYLTTVRNNQYARPFTI